MAAFGPESEQVHINVLFKCFFESQVEGSESAPLDAQKTLLKELFAIIYKSSDRDQLTLNPPIVVNHKIITPMELIASSNYNLLGEQLPLMSKELKVRYEPAVSASLPTPTRMVQHADESLVDEHQHPYVITRKLEGRGQAGLANFYSNGQQEMLIKEDDEATCLLEGTAFFVKNIQVLPPALQDCVNYASVGSVVKKGTGEIKTVSIQPRVMPIEPQGKVRPWDEIVYGIKRPPQTLLSYEAWYPERIKQNIASLSPQVKWQLAASLLACAIAGDESLHVGQFMALLDSEDNITGIKRIDLGARERYAVERIKQHQNDPFHDSTQYQAHGQWGKDYISYLLAEAALKKMYILLWVNIANSMKPEELKSKIIQSSKDAFIQQFQAMPANLQEKTLWDVVAVINKDCKTGGIELSGETIQEKVLSLAQQLAEIDARRTLDMMKIAQQEYHKISQVAHQRLLPLKDTSTQSLLLRVLELQQSLMLPSAKRAEQLKEARELSNVLHEQITALVQEVEKGKSSTEDYKQLQLMGEMAADLMQVVYLQVLNAAPLLKENQAQLLLMADEINKFQSIRDLALYCQNTKSLDKVPYAIKMMKNALISKVAMQKCLANPDLARKMTMHSSSFSFAKSYVATTHSEGETLLRKMLTRYQLDDSSITLTDNARKLISLLNKKEMAAAAKLVASSDFSISDAILKDEKGMTVLHYLMAMEEIDKNGMEVIGTLLSKAIGSTYNTKIDIPNREGKTPLDLLLENKNAKTIIEAVNQKKIKGYGGGCYRAPDFFDMNKYENKVKEKLADLSPPSKPKSKSWW